jgi:hypothetical protein
MCYIVSVKETTDHSTTMTARTEAIATLVFISFPFVLLLIMRLLEK